MIGGVRRAWSMKYGLLVLQNKEDNIVVDRGKTTAALQHGCSSVTGGQPHGINEITPRFLVSYTYPSSDNPKT
ncbi:hypothetical protein HAX54_025728 [Datura stramonium]|uniref:Uncharacterized protein n=1 Tax=Datura stramonium TaxID=4076 RepID=A0ABS8V095_DATST|nr:hypothetical protein [Datura stramonium]